MSETITLREFQAEDVPALSNIIRKTWGYDKFCSPRTAQKLARLYLYSCLANQTFTQVALAGNTPAGIIMGKNIKTHRCPLKYRIKQAASAITLLFTQEGREVCRFFKGVNGIDEALLKESGTDYQGEVAFFAIDSRARGKGIGKRLFHTLLAYMRTENLHDIYLFTDTSCNYGFYEHQGMTRRCEKKTNIKMQNKEAEMSFFLYDYHC